MSIGLPFPQLQPIGAQAVPLLTDEGLFEACGVRIAFTGREGGVSGGPFAKLNTGGHVGDDPALVQRNREIVLEALGFDGAALVVPKQVHGTDIVRVGSAADVARAMQQAADGADAVMVEVPGIGALLNFADCLPLVIVAPDGRFSVVHAGWRGALAGIAGKAARALAQAQGAAGGDAADDGRVEGDGGACRADCAEGFNAYIGPHIRSECFETSEDIAAQFADRYGADVLADGRHVSLSRVVATDLMRAGVSQRRIADAGLCTVCNSDRYFSYRATDGACGRQAAFAIACGKGTHVEKGQTLFHIR